MMIATICPGLSDKKDLIVLQSPLSWNAEVRVNRKNLRPCSSRFVELSNLSYQMALTICRANIGAFIALYFLQKVCALG
jgi:hypothetical protein